MKKLYLIVFLSAFVFFANINTAKAQTQLDSELIIVKTYEVWTSLYPSEIVISYGNEKTERIELENLKSKNWSKNLDKINYVLSKIQKQGYELTHTTAGGGDAVSITTFVFKRKEQI